MRQHIISDQSD